MATSYEIPNIINQGKNVGTCNNPYFFHITSGERIKKSAMWLEDMNPRKQSTVDREKKVLEIMQIFSEEGDLEDPISLCNFCARFSLYDETVSIFESPRHITQL